MAISRPEAKTPSPDQDQFILTTAQFAALNCTSPLTVGWRLSRFKSYFGVTPLKLANGRNLWPAIQVVAKQPEAK